MDPSNGYEGVAPSFIKGRGQAVRGIGASAVRGWAKTLLPGSIVLDIGCGTGIPVSKILIEEGMTVYGIDGSPSLAAAFHSNFPDAPIACEAVEDSAFFDRKFDGIIAWGLLFLLPESSQLLLIQKVTAALNIGGKFVFTSPPVRASWFDVMTKLESRSLGAERYKQLLSDAGLSLIEEMEDEGENHYYLTIKTS